MSLEDYLASRTRDRHRIPSTEEEDSTAVLGSQLLPSAGPSRFHSLRSIIKGLPDQEDLDGEGYYGGGNDLQPTTTHFESTVPQDEQQWSSRRQSRVAPKPVAKSPANFARAGRHFDLASMVSAEDSSVLAPQEYLEARQTPAMVVRDMDQTMDVHQTSDGTRNDFELVLSGWLQRKGAVLTWRQVYVTVHRREGAPGVVSVFKEQGSPEATLTLDLAYMLDVYPRESSRRFEFAVTMRRQEVVFAAASRDDLFHWIEAIKSVARAQSSEHFFLDVERQVQPEEVRQLHSVNEQLARENEELQRSLEQMQRKFDEQESQLRSVVARSQQMEAGTREHVEALTSQLESVQAQRQQLEDQLKQAMEQKPVGAAAGDNNAALQELKLALESVEDELRELTMASKNASGTKADTAAIITTIQSKLDAYQAHLTQQISSISEDISSSTASTTSDSLATSVLSALAHTENQVKQVSNATGTINSTVKLIHGETSATRNDIKTILTGIDTLKRLVEEKSAIVGRPQDGHSVTPCTVKDTEDNDMSAPASPSVKHRIARIESAVTNVGQPIPTRSLSAIGDSLQSVTQYLEKSTSSPSSRDGAFQRKMDELVKTVEVLPGQRASGSKDVATELSPRFASIELALAEIQTKLSESNSSTKDVTALVETCDATRSAVEGIQKALVKIHKCVSDDSTISLMSQQTSNILVMLDALNADNGGKQSDEQYLRDIKETLDSIHFIVDDSKKAVDQTVVSSERVATAIAETSETLGDIVAKLGSLPADMETLKDALVDGLQSLKNPSASAQEKSIAATLIMQQLNEHFSTAQKSDETVIQMLQQVQASVGAISLATANDSHSTIDADSVLGSPILGHTRARSLSPRKLLRDTLQEERFIELQSAVNAIRDRITSVHTSIKNIGDNEEHLQSLRKDMHALGEACEGIKRAQQHMNENVLGSDQAWRTELRQAVRFDHEKLCAIERQMASIGDHFQPGGIILGGSMTHDVLVKRISEMHAVCTEIQEKVGQSGKSVLGESAVEVKMPTDWTKKLDLLRDDLTAAYSREITRYTERMDRVLASLPEGDTTGNATFTTDQVESSSAAILSELALLREEVRNSRSVIEPQFGVLSQQVGQLAEALKADEAVNKEEHTKSQDIFDAVSSADSDVESSVDSDVRSSAASEVESSADSDAESSADSEVSIVSKASATKSHNVEVVAQTTATCPIDDTVTKLMVQVDRLRDNISSLNAEKSTIVVELQQTAREHHIAQEELTSVRGKISALQEWCTSLESATSKLSEEQAALVTQKTVAESTVAHIREDLEQLEQQRSRMQDQLQTMTLEKTGVEEDRDAAKEAVAALEACKEEKRLELQEITGELSKCRMEMEVLHLERESVQTQLQRETDLLKMLQTTLVPAAKSIQQTMSVAPAATVAAPSANDSAVSLNSDIDDLEGKLHGRVEVLLKEITTLQSQKQVLLADIQALDRLPPVMKRMPRGGLSSSSAAAGKQRRSVSFSAPAVTSVLGESVFSSSSDEEARV